ncbi:IS3 family transposase [Micromonospora sp. DT31]|uniref:IS3 family transposase n=1 Tax=Micromonospora sp. DT31 TaxID=3393434 RepID=UPI003CFB7AF5
MNVYPFIEAEKAWPDGSVKRSCELLEVSRSAYYQHRAGPSRRERDDADLTARIADVHAVSAGTYGAPGVRAELAAQGRRHSRKRSPG